jgi:hypothetical protein
MVHAAVAVVHFEGWNIISQRQQLLPQANTKRGLVFFQDFFHRVAPHTSWKPDRRDRLR